MRSGPRSSPDEPASADESPSPRTRARRWLLSHGLHVETLLAATIVAVATVTVVVVLLGALTALPTGPPPEGDGSGSSATGGVLGLGTTLLNGTIVLTVALGALVVFHGAVELWTAVRSGRGRGRGHNTGRSRAYVGVRAIQTAAAVAFVAPILAGTVLSRIGVVGDAPPNALILFLLLSGLVLLGSVLAHAFVRLVRSITKG